MWWPSLAGFKNGWGKENLSFHGLMYSQVNKAVIAVLVFGVQRPEQMRKPKWKQSFEVCHRPLASVTPFVHVIPTYTRIPLDGSSLSRYSPGKYLWAVGLWVVLCGSTFFRHGGAEGWGWSWLQHFKILWSSVMGFLGAKIVIPYLSLFVKI